MDGITLNDNAQKIVRYYLPENQTVLKLADFFQVFCDITRLKILFSLAVTEMCVTDLAQTLSINQSTLSHQLKYLRQLNMVKYRRNGKVIYYSLTNKCVDELINVSINYINNDK